MDNNSLSKDLWQTSNILTGFSVVQALAFVYACTKPEFNFIINTFWCKFIIVIAVFIGACIQCYSVWWCTNKIIILIKYDNNSIDANGTFRVTDEAIKIIKQTSVWRMCIIIVLIIPIILCLYAHQLRGGSFNPPTTSNKKEINRSALDIRQRELSKIG